MPKTILFSTYGARGDVFPYLAIALKLKRHGHRPIIATSRDYSAEIESLGLEFRAVSPDSPTPAQAEKMMHTVRGTEFLFRDLLLPSLRKSVLELREIARDADVLVTHTTSLAGPIVAEMEAKRGLKWVSSAVSPLALLEPDAALPAFPKTASFPVLNRALLSLLKRQFGIKLKKTQEIRQSFGVSRGDNALWSDAHSNALQLALWPQFFAPIAPESARKAIGFCFLEGQTRLAPDFAPDLEAFLGAGAAPIVFVAASFANSAKWERESEAAATKLGKRAILCGARGDSASATVFRCRFAPLERVLLRASALVHAGGIGTLALGMRAGVPMLLLPRAHDQFDNARRAGKLGIARIGRRSDLAAQIAALLGDEGLKTRLETARGEIGDGAKVAAEILVS